MESIIYKWGGQKKTAMSLWPLHSLCLILLLCFIRVAGLNEVVERCIFSFPANLGPDSVQYTQCIKLFPPEYPSHKNLVSHSCWKVYSSYGWNVFTINCKISENLGWIQVLYYFTMECTDMVLNLVTLWSPSDGHFGFCLRNGLSLPILTCL